MKGAAALLLEVAGPLPRLAFIIGKRHGQTLSSAGGIVVDQQPVRVAETHCVQARAGIRHLRCAYLSPTDALVARFGDTNAVQWPVLAHVGNKRSIVLLQHSRLNVTEAGQRPAREPRLTTVVADGHDRNAVGV